MIITSDFLNSFLKGVFSGCDEYVADVDEFLSTYGDIQTFDFIIEKLKEKNLTRWVKILTIKKYEIIKMLGDYTYGKYRVYNPITNIFIEYETLEEAQQSQDTIRQEWLKHESLRWAVNQEIDNQDGTITWKPVDWETFSEPDSYQVFVHTTGQYVFCPTVEEAKQKLKELQDAFIDAYQPKIQQQIIHADGDTAWGIVEIQ